MLTFAYYILKIIICSGILYGYYLLALKNKIFHSWNRFYLLAAVVLSLAVPLIKINISQKPEEPTTQVIHLIQSVNTGDEFIYEYSKNTQGFHFNANNISIIIYVIVSILLLIILLQTFIKINQLKQTNKQTIVEGINFINTNAKGTPFSFFNNIFWNNKIDLNTSVGKQIFQHEVVHVHEKHSYDKVFMNITLIFFWSNPFFWIIKNELNMIHEFIADKKAVEDSDTAAFAAMILQATYPMQRFNITNNFFYSPLKRRLAMLTKNNNPKINYLSRLLVLPLAALVFFAFTLKLKTHDSATHYTGKKINIIIDAGHGGSDKGVAVDNIEEKNITLALAKEIEALNTNQNIHIILTRNADNTMGVKDRTALAKSLHADLFISIHVDAEMNKNSHSGVTILIPGNGSSYFEESKELGSDIIESFKSNYALPVDDNLMQREKGVWILNNNSSPAVLIEAGFLTTARDKDFLTKPENQKIIAKNILNGIEKYAQEKLNTINFKPLKDTMPEKKYLGLFADTEKEATIIKVPKNSMYHGIKILKAEMKSDNILLLSLAHGKTAEISKDEAVKLGFTIFTPPVIVENTQEAVFLKSKPAITSDTTPKRFMKESNATDKEISQSPLISTQTETPAQFPGGSEAWVRYITKVIKENIDSLIESNNQGTVFVKFIVNTDGTVSDVHATSMQGTKLAEVAVNAIRKGPKWIPAMQKGHIVISYREQPVTFTVKEEANDKRIIKEGDNIFVHLVRGNNNSIQIKYPINNDGRIYYKGEYIMVKGLTFEDAKKVITGLFQKLAPQETITSISIIDKT